ncbi:MAG: hypothetical protein MSA82_07240 [Oscillospiraceae bacterium]|nr:hypothetical protein [Oscillospiraceae bacterium]
MRSLSNYALIAMEEIHPIRAGITAMTTGAVTGGYAPYMNYGARVNLTFA